MRGNWGSHGKYAQMGDNRNHLDQISYISTQPAQVAFDAYRDERFTQCIAVEQEWTGCPPESGRLITIATLAASPSPPVWGSGGPSFRHSVGLFSTRRWFALGPVVIRFLSSAPHSFRNDSRFQMIWPFGCFRGEI